MPWVVERNGRMELFSMQKLLEQLGKIPIAWWILVILFFIVFGIGVAILSKTSGYLYRKFPNLRSKEHPKLFKLTPWIFLFPFSILIGKFSLDDQLKKFTNYYRIIFVLQMLLLLLVVVYLFFIPIQ